MRRRNPIRRPARCRGGLRLNDGVLTGIPRELQEHEALISVPCPVKERPPEKTEVAFARNISAQLRNRILSREGLFCVMCGAAPGDIDETTGRKCRFHVSAIDDKDVGHIKDKSLGGRNELSNLRALCSTCNQGAKNITTEKPSAIWLLSQTRRAGR